MSTFFSQNRYLDEFIRLKCAPDLLKYKIFPNTKEITETMGAYHAYRKFLMKDFHLSDENIAVITPGDGVCARTAVYFAHLSKFTCFAVDPLTRGHTAPKVNRDVEQKGKGEDFHWNDGCRPKKVLIIGVHAHLQPSDLVFNMGGSERTGIIWIPCCFKIPKKVENSADYVYFDQHILSPQNKIFVWNIDNRK